MPLFLLSSVKTKRHKIRASHEESETHTHADTRKGKEENEEVMHG